MYNNDNINNNTNINTAVDEYENIPSAEFTIDLIDRNTTIGFTVDGDNRIVPSATFAIERAAAIGLYNFIREHLDVVNETPCAEAMMMALETAFDLGNDSEE